MMSVKKHITYKNLPILIAILAIAAISFFIFSQSMASGNIMNKITEPVFQAAPITVSDMETMAWVYPGSPACNARTEMKDGRKINILKPEFFTVKNGSLHLIPDTEGCNGFSTEFITELKQYSEEQYVTVSAAGVDNIDSFLNRSLDDTENLTTLVKFVVHNDLTGIELDFESFGDWDNDVYRNYLQFVTVLGHELHAEGKKLMIDGPAIWNKTSESWFNWRYEDFANLPVDKVVVMAYDYHFDYGAGSPVAPMQWTKEVASYTANRLPLEKISIGIPSYGYQGRNGTYRSTILTYEQSKTRQGFISANRDPRSGEMTWQSGANTYFYNDSVSMDMKRQLLADMGITSISVWHLGGNQWFSN